MLTLVLSLALNYGGVGHAAAACCGAGGPFADTFAELLGAEFLVPSRTTRGPSPYVITADGERKYLNSAIWDAARRIAARVHQTPDFTGPAPESWAKLRGALGSWIKVWHQELSASQARGQTVEWARAAKVRARMVTLEATASFLDVFYRAGVAAAGAVALGELIEHWVVPGPIPLCKFVAAGCLWAARETKDLGRAFFGAYPGVESRRERVRLIHLARSLRRQRAQALRLVIHPGGADVEVPDGPLAPGARAMADGCFASALGTPDFSGHECATPPGGGLRYGKLGAGRARPKGFAPRADEIAPPPADLVGDTLEGDLVERVWAGDDLIDFLNLKLEFARAAAAEVGRVDARAFLGLRRKLARMRKSLDLYAYTIKLRAALGRPRTADEARLDEQFNGVVKSFLLDFDRGVRLALVGLGREPHPYAEAFRRAPRRAFEMVREWLRGASCAPLFATHAP